MGTVCGPTGTRTGISLVEDVVFGSGWLSRTIETQQLDGHALNGWLPIDYEDVDAQTYAGALHGKIAGTWRSGWPGYSMISTTCTRM